MNDDELRLAALDILAPVLSDGPSYLSFELRLSDGNETALNNQRDKIQEYRERVSRMTDARVRKAYNHWLDFYQRENDKARREMETGARRKSWLEHETKRKAKDSRIEECSAKIPKP